MTGAVRRATAQQRFSALLVACGCATVGILGWFAFDATREWRHASELLAQRRAEQTADLLMRALQRDMRGGEALVLKRVQWNRQLLAPPFDLTNVAAGAFARYPYIEAFFAWDGSSRSNPVFFVRTNRRPGWLGGADHGGRFPVLVAREVGMVEAFAEPLRAGADVRRPLTTFQAAVAGSEYQVVARLMYGAVGQFDGALGFFVDLDWVRQHYFPDLLRQISRIAAPGEKLRMAISDQDGKLIAGDFVDDGVLTVTRGFHPMFFDTALAALRGGAPLVGAWTISVSARDDPQVAWAMHGANRTVGLTVIATIALGAGLALAAKAWRASADLAKVRSDFVSTVTHELKTPLTTIRTVGAAFVQGRLTDPQEIREYSQILDQEAKRLARLLDNLLAYSRVTDLSEVYAFEAMAIADLLDDVLQRFQPQFASEGFAVTVDLAPHLPEVRGDRTALGLAIDNLIDNALRYSDRRRALDLRAWPGPGGVHLRLTDRGIGIPADELSRVTRRFVRGRGVQVPGSGLGLAIVSRVVADHGGQLSIASEVGTGTTVEITLPIAEKRVS